MLLHHSTKFYTNPSSFSQCLSEKITFLLFSFHILSSLTFAAAQLAGQRFGCDAKRSTSDAESWKHNNNNSCKHNSNKCNDSSNNNNAEQHQTRATTTTDATAALASDQQQQQQQPQAEQQFQLQQQQQQ